MIDGELASESNQQVPCVLIVDDDPAIRRMLGNILRSEQPFDILEAEDGLVAQKGYGNDEQEAPNQVVCRDGVGFGAPPDRGSRWSR